MSIHFVFMETCPNCSGTAKVKIGRHWEPCDYCVNGKIEAVPSAVVERENEGTDGEIVS